MLTTFVRFLNLKLFFTLGEGTPLRLFLGLSSWLRAMALGWAQGSRKRPWIRAPD